MPQTTPAQHTVPNEYLTVIGDITVSFAMLEDAMKFLVQLQIQDNKMTARIVTAQLSFNNLKDLIMSLYMRRGSRDSYFLDVKELMNRASVIEGERNQITHSVWTGGSGLSYIIRNKVTARGKDGLKLVGEQMTVEKLQELASKIKYLAGDVKIFAEKYSHEIRRSANT